jgi:hypothetical protein
MKECLFKLFFIIFPYSLIQGTARRKKKVIHRTATTDDKKLQSTLKKLAVNNIPGIEEVCDCKKIFKQFYD